MRRNAKLQVAAVGIAVLVLFSLIMIPFAYNQVPEGHVGVEKDWGAVNGETLSSGANWIIPIQQSVQSVEIRPRTYTMSATQGEGDRDAGDAISVKTVNGTTVDVDVTVRYRIRSSDADQFVSDWNNERQMELRLIRPTIRSDLRDEASDLQTTGNNAIYTRDGREALKETAKSSLVEKFEGEPIILEEVQIRNINLPDSIDETLDEKEEAKQQVEVEEQRVQQEEQRAEQQIVKAEADAREDVIAAQADANATRIRGEALDEYPIVLQQQLINQMGDGTVYLGAMESLALTREVNGTAAP